ncbi:hypothetical protein GCM10027290_02810 [Micromonospora sonneratiae]|uniref:DUF47 domain-containing protein n=1 Tax=Micromonospora sonneratiae TaxID=1184706 RepID=A0ABW3Y593_9ACTN
MSRLRRLLDDLAGRSHRRIVGLLVEQIDATLDGVSLAIGVTSGHVEPARARALMSDVEHLGDSHRARLVPELSAALTTPIDREDLFRLSRSIDDVLDHLRDYVRETDLYGVRLDGDAVALLEQVNLGLQDLRRAVNRILPRPQEVPEAALAAHKRAGQVRHRYGICLTVLLSGGVDAAVLKRRELLRRLDVVGLRLGEAADALADAMLKRTL